MVLSGSWIDLILPPCVIAIATTLAWCPDRWRALASALLRWINGDR